MALSAPVNYTRQVVPALVVWDQHVNTLLLQIVCSRSSPKEVGL